MKRNRTSYKSLNVLENDERVSQAFVDEDGIWIWLNPGWTADPHDAHDIHEDTVGAALDKYRRIVKCVCADCIKAKGENWA